MQNIMMHLRCNELNELAGAVSKRKFYDDYEFNELYELAGAVRNRLRFHFVKFVKININAQPKFVKFVKFVVLKKQCAAQITASTHESSTSFV